MEWKKTNLGEVVSIDYRKSGHTRFYQRVVDGTIPLNQERILKGARTTIRPYVFEKHRLEQEDGYLQAILMRGEGVSVFGQVYSLTKKNNDTIRTVYFDDDTLESVRFDDQKEEKYFFTKDFFSEDDIGRFKSLAEWLKFNKIYGGSSIHYALDKLTDWQHKGTGTFNYVRDYSLEQ